MRRRGVTRIGIGIGSIALLLVVGYTGHHLWVTRASASVADVTTQTADAARITAPNSAPLAEAVRKHRTITVAGIGSSVGVGAELDDADVQSPVGRLGVLLRSQYPADTVTVKNFSVDGSTAFDGEKVYTDRVRPVHPTVLLIAFGMNDGQTAQYNSGVTLPGSIGALRSIIEMARADGTTVLVATTPSPNTDGNDFSLPAGLPIGYPNRGGALVPSVAHSVTTIDGSPFSARHRTWNAQARTLVKNEHVTLVDAAKYWPAAERRYGQDALFNVQHGPADPGRFVHPNLLGHQSSYWIAESDVVRRLAKTG